MRILFVVLVLSLVLFCLAEAAKEGRRKSGKNGKVQGRKGKITKKQGRRRTHKKTLKSGNAKSVARVNKVGAGCEYVVLSELTTKATDCVNGAKFVIKPGSNARRQYVIMNDKPHLLWVTIGTKFTDCTAFTDRTASISCKAVDGLAAIDLGVTGAPSTNTTAKPSSGSSWGYTADNGPDKWAEKYPLCGASSQSPLDLDVSTAAASQFTLPLEFIGYETPLKATVSQNSHTFTFKPVVDKLLLPKGLPTIKGGSLPAGEIFEFAQFHLHWGKDDTKGSEHRLVGAMLPAEIHLVHWNKKYPDFGTAAAQSDGLAVVGFFYQVAASSNAKYTPILDGLKKLPGTENNFEVDIGSITLNDLIPAGATDHLHYKGSLTTPPCLESVFWNVFTDKIDLSDADLTVIRGVTDENGKSLSDNYRPPQPLNGRTVYSYKKA